MFIFLYFVEKGNPGSIPDNERIIKNLESGPSIQVIK